MLKRILPFLFSAVVTACSGLAPSGSGAPEGGALAPPQEPPPAYAQAPGFPAGNPGPDVTPEDKKFHFFIFPKLEAYEQPVSIGSIKAKLSGVRVSGTVSCQVSEHATQPCQEGLALRIVDMTFNRFVEAKISVAPQGKLSFQAELPGSSLPQGPANFEYWVFYLNYDPSYVPAPQSILDCPEPSDDKSQLVCLPSNQATWGVGYPLESDAI